ncbi:MAG: hypothetical protein Q9187_000735 [Circinaria calcarea]
MASLLDPVSRTPLQPSARRSIFNAVWNTDHDEKHFANLADKVQSYFRYYEDQCSQSRITVKSHQDILEVIRCLKDGRENLESIKQKLCPSINPAGDGKDVDAFIALAARLWLMMYIGDIGHSLTPGSTQIMWREETLDDLIGGVFSGRHEIESTVKLEKIFNACNLERVAGIRVSWTNNLADHLLMKDDDTRNIISHAFPPGFVDETLRTLSLLLPPNNQTVRKWFRAKQGRRAKQQERGCLDFKACSCGHLNTAGRQIGEFKYWRDRLVILKQVFDDSEPKKIQQWWNDDRKKVQCPEDLELLHSLILLRNGSLIDPRRRLLTSSSGSGSTKGSGDVVEVPVDSPPTPVSFWDMPSEVQDTESDFMSSTYRVLRSKVAEREVEPGIERLWKLDPSSKESHFARTVALKAYHDKGKSKLLRTPSPEWMAMMRKDREEEQHQRRLKGLKEEAARRAQANRPLLDGLDGLALYCGSGDNEESEEGGEIMSVEDSDGEDIDRQDEVFSVDETSSQSDPGTEGGWQDLCAASIDAYGFGVPFEIRCERAEGVLALELRQRQFPKSFEERRHLQDAASLLLDVRDKALKRHKVAQMLDGDETESEDEVEAEEEVEGKGRVSQPTSNTLAEHLATGSQAVVDGRLVLILNTPRQACLASTSGHVEDSAAAREARLEADRAAMPPPPKVPDAGARHETIPKGSPTAASRKMKAAVQAKTTSENQIEQFIIEASSSLVIPKDVGDGAVKDTSADTETGSAEPRTKRQKTGAMEQKVKKGKAEGPVRSRGGRGRILKKTKKFGEE